MNEGLVKIDDYTFLICIFRSFLSEKRFPSFDSARGTVASALSRRSASIFSPSLAPRGTNGAGADSGRGI